MEKDAAVETMLWEYREMRQEIRDLIASLDTNLRMAVTSMGVVVSVGLSVDSKLFCLGPSLLFAFCAIHFLKSAAIGVLGTYCQAIADRLKAKVGASNVVMDWEGGKLWEHTSQLTSVVVCGFYLFFVPVIALFIWLSWESFKIYDWSLGIHGAELVVTIIYAIRVMSYGSSKERQRYIKDYIIAEHPALAEPGSPPDVAR